MFIRIVKMSFELDKIETFKALFDSKKDLIRNFEGCQFLELYQDRTLNHIFFTYSYWNDEKDLERYKQSNLFKSVWSETKQLFNDKPQAWSVNKLVSLP